MLALSPQAGSPTTAEKCQLWIERARTRVGYYTKHCDEKFIMGRFHSLVAHKMDQVIDGKIKRLIISVPPRHGKTTVAAENAIPVAMARRKGIECVYTTYNQPRALDVARKIRNRTKQERHVEIFPDCRVRQDQTKLEDFATTNGSTLRSVGIGGSLTGRGADLAVIDDPFKNRQEAESPVIREKVWNWYLSTLYTRLSPEGAIVIIMTRWHTDDLVGRLLSPKYKAQLAEEGVDEQWEVIELEAICDTPEKDILKRKEGEALDPNRWPEKKLRAKKAVLGAYEWNALYQQKPRNRGGNYVDTTKIKLITMDQVPKRGMRLFRYWDLATTAKQTSDFCAGALGGVVRRKHGTKNEDEWVDVYLLHMCWFKAEWHEQKRRMVQQSHLDGNKPTIGIEAVGGFRTAYFELQKALDGDAIVREHVPDDDKLTRALPWFSKIEAGTFHMVVGPWNQNFLDELNQFPTGDHDDQVDGVSGMYGMAMRARGILLA